MANRDHYEQLGAQIGAHVDKAQQACGDSFGRSGYVLEELLVDYWDGDRQVYMMPASSLRSWATASTRSGVRTGSRRRRTVANAAHIEALIERIESVEELAAGFVRTADGRMDAEGHAYHLATGEMPAVGQEVLIGEHLDTVSDWLGVDSFYLDALQDANDTTPDEDRKAVVLAELQGWLEQADGA